MNYYYNFYHNEFHSELTIPFFDPNAKYHNNLILHEAYIENSRWVIKSISKNFLDHKITSNVHNKNHLYFLYDENLNGKILDKLIVRAGFLETDPGYRSNMSINVQNKLKSCYQGEYTCFMLDKRGGILAFQNSCLNKNFNNFLIFTNFIDEPKVYDFEIYLFNINKKKIIKTFNCKTNQSNIFKLNNIDEFKDCILLNKKFIGAPQIFSYSLEESSVSFEHTQPPGCYIWEQPYIGKLKKQYTEMLSNCL